MAIEPSGGFSTPVVLAGDTTALMAILASLAGLIPSIAGVIALIWYGIQIWESRTVRVFVQRRRERRILRLTAKLAAMQLESTARSARIEIKAAAQVAAQDLRAAQNQPSKD